MRLTAGEDTLPACWILKNPPGILGSVVEEGGDDLVLGAAVVDHDAGDSEQVAHVGDLRTLAGLLPVEFQGEGECAFESVVIEHGLSWVESRNGRLI